MNSNLNSNVIPQKRVVKRAGKLKRKKVSFIGRSYKKARTSKSSTSITQSSTMFSSSIQLPTRLIPFHEMPHSKLSFGSKNQKLKSSEQEKMRIAIEVLFKRVYYDTFAIENLTSVVTNICTMFNYPHRASVRHIILEVKNSIDVDLEYNSTRKNFIHENKRKIDKSSLEEEMLTELMERGNSYETTTKVFNATHCADNSIPKIGLRAIYNAIQRCRFIVSSTESIPQTDENNQFHHQARFNWFCQLHTRFGGTVETPHIEGVLEYRERLNNEWINKEMLEQLKLTFVPEQIAFWDEIHIYQVCGDHHDKTLIFSRDEQGQYDESGTFDGTEKKVSNCNNQSITTITVFLYIKILTDLQ